MDLITNELTDDEKFLMEEAVYKFNPCLKFLLYSFNPQAFVQYAFNSCRQTAFLGSLYLTKLCKEKNIPYTFETFEADCDDVLFGEDVHYVHYYIYGTNTVNGRHLFIDISRTQQPLIFCYVKENKYPQAKECYEDLKVLSTTKIVWQSALNAIEFFTSKTGYQVETMLEEMIDAMYEKMSKEKQREFADSIYSRFTDFIRKQRGMVPIYSSLSVRKIDLLE